METSQDEVDDDIFEGEGTGGGESELENDEDVEDDEYVTRPSSLSTGRSTASRHLMVKLKVAMTYLGFLGTALPSAALPSSVENLAASSSAEPPPSAMPTNASPQQEDPSSDTVAVARRVDTTTADKLDKQEHKEQDVQSPLGKTTTVSTRQNHGITTSDQTSSGVRLARAVKDASKAREHFHHWRLEANKSKKRAGAITKHVTLVEEDLSQQRDSAAQSEAQVEQIRAELEQTEEQARQSKAEATRSEVELAKIRRQLDEVEVQVRQRKEQACHFETQAECVQAQYNKYEDQFSGYKNQAIHSEKQVERLRMELREARAWASQADERRGLECKVYDSAEKSVKLLEEMREQERRCSDRPPIAQSSKPE